MTRGGISRHVLLVLGLAVLAYAVCFHVIQHRRVVRGPWEVTFACERGMPALVANHGGLGITNVQVVFTAPGFPTRAPETIRFTEGRPVPFPLPFGRCVFLDPLFLPGTVVVEAFGHQVQLMPRALTIDGAERPWCSGDVIRLPQPSSPTGKPTP